MPKAFLLLVPVLSSNNEQHAYPEKNMLCCYRVDEHNSEVHGVKFQKPSHKATSFVCVSLKTKQTKTV